MFTEARNEVNRVLLKCDSMQSLEKRRRVVQDLPDEIKFGIAEDNTPNIHISNIIDRCVAFPGGLRNLLESLEHYEGGTRALHKAAPLVLGLELLKIIEDEDEIGEAEISSFFSDSIPRFQPPRQAASVWAQITLLWQMRPLPNHRSPILRYVDQIIEHSTWSEAELRAWQTWALDRSFLGLQKGNEKIEDTDNECVDPYLTVVVRPLPPSEDGHSPAYQVTTYLWQDQTRVLQLETGKQLTRLQEQMPDLVAQAINEASRILRHHTPNLSIEFCLPHDLLSGELDQLAKPDEQTACFGMHYPVVVRPFDRLMGSYETRGWWEWRWQQLKRRVNENNPEEARIWICSLPVQERENVLSQLADQTRKICYLGLAFAWEHQEVEEMLNEVIRKGLPVALWPRRHLAPLDPSETEVFLNEVLCDEFIVDLPRHLQRRRLYVHHQQNHPGNHMTLLWDDADRIPPPFPGGARPFTSTGL